MKKSNIGTWILAAVLSAFLIWAVIAAYSGWRIDGDAGMPSVGYAALAFGVVISLIVGIGLMALVFYSSRAGYDEPPQYDLRKDDKPTPPSESENNEHGKAGKSPGIASPKSASTPDPR